jgi:signal transduction histidine kinase
MGIICILENSFNQTLAYHLDGPEATYVGKRDLHDPRFDHLEYSADINSYVQDRAGPPSRSYRAVPLNQKFGRYTLRIYPAEDVVFSNKPWAYALLVASIFFFTSFVYIAFAFAVERRQKIVMETAIKNARKAADTERELNEFLAHEVRNPLSAAISACSFVNSAISETIYICDSDFKGSVLGDVKIIDSSLHFVNDFLRSMLDIHRASANQLQVKLAPTDLLTDILEPVSSMLYQRDLDIDITVDCPENLIVATDCLRLKQVVLNLGRNSIKFVEKGFIRFRAAVVDGLVELYVEDSGPGVPKDKLHVRTMRKLFFFFQHIHLTQPTLNQGLFEKFQTSLDVLSQGTGIG